MGKKLQILFGEDSISYISIARDVAKKYPEYIE
jgi:hypothetical protein